MARKLQLSALQERLQDLDGWYKKYLSLSDRYEACILQTSSRDALLEKGVSIAFSFFIMFIVSSILSLLGGPAGFLVSLILFAIGWGISKLINLKLFGKERSYENLTEDEQAFLDQLESLKKSIKSNYLRTKLRKDNIYFGYFVRSRTELEEFHDLVSNLSTGKLAIKYRMEFESLRGKNGIMKKRFIEIYGGRK